MSLAAPPKAIYPDIDSAFSEIQEHAKEHGYALFRSYKKPSRVVFACDRARKYDLGARILILTALNNAKTLALRSVNV
jgi:hypothetical protein